MSGYLKVLVGDGSWCTCYAVLEGTKLRYWPTKEDKEVQGRPLGDLELTGATLKDISEPNTWVVTTASRTHTYFQASTQQQKDEWLGLLQHYPSGMQAVKRVTLNDFKKKMVLGQGSYGKVYMVVKKDTGKCYAMKEMSKEKMKQADIKAPFDEKRILECVDHPFIVKLYYSFQDSRNLYMILDLLAGGELFTYIIDNAPLPEETVKFYIAQVGCAIGHLHSQNIIYRDLKPENVVFDAEGHACLTDFGLAKSNVYEASAETFCGTNEYLAPELLKDIPHGKAVDWWSLGLMMYEMLFSDLPFYDENPVRMHERILCEPLRFPNNVHISDEAKNLISRLLDKDSLTRLQTLEEFKSHPFFASLDFNRLLRRELTPPIHPSSDPTNNFSREYTEQPIDSSTDSIGEITTLAGYTYDRELMGSSTGGSSVGRSPVHGPQQTRPLPAVPHQASTSDTLARTTDRSGGAGKKKSTDDANTVGAQLSANNPCTPNATAAAKKTPTATTVAGSSKLNSAISAKRMPLPITVSSPKGSASATTKKKVVGVPSSSVKNAK